MRRRRTRAQRYLNIGSFLCPFQSLKRIFMYKDHGTPHSNKFPLFHPWLFGMLREKTVCGACWATREICEFSTSSWERLHTNLETGEFEVAHHCNNFGANCLGEDSKIPAMLQTPTLENYYVTSLSLSTSVVGAFLWHSLQENYIGKGLRDRVEPCTLLNKLWWVELRIGPVVVQLEVKFVRNMAAMFL